MPTKLGSKGETVGSVHSARASDGISKPCRLEKCRSTAVRIPTLIRSAPSDRDLREMSSRSALHRQALEFATRPGGRNWVVIRFPGGPLPYCSSSSVRSIPACPDWRDRLARPAGRRTLDAFVVASRSFDPTLQTGPKSNSAAVASARAQSAIPGASFQIGDLGKVRS